MADLFTTCQPDGGLAIFDHSWLIAILPPSSLCKQMPCNAGDPGNWAQDRYLHGGALAVLVAMIFISTAFAAGAWFNRGEGDHISPQEDEAQMACLRDYTRKIHREANDA